MSSEEVVVQAEVVVECSSRHPETGQACTITGSTHALHAAPGSTWTDADIVDANDPSKVLVRAIKDNTKALNRIADGIEHFAEEKLHRVR